MKLLARFFLWLVRIASGIGVILFTVGAIIGMYRSVCIGLAVVSLIAFIFSAKAGKKVRKATYAKCSHCGASLANAFITWDYDLKKVKENKTYGLELPVSINIKCPKCRKEKFLYESLYFQSETQMYPDNVENKVKQALYSRMKGE